MRTAIAIVALLASTASADKTKTPTDELKTTLNDQLNWGTSNSPRFAFHKDKTAPLGSDVYASLSMGDIDPQNVVIGFSSDGKDAFVASDLREYGDCGGSGNCGVTLGWLHASILYEKDGGRWEPAVWHVAELSAGAAGDPIARKIEDADDAVKVFETTLGDPKAFAKTVSDRKEVVLYGSDKGERFVGGAKVKGKLTSWNLTLTVHDGVQAGLSSGKTLAWVAANVDARPAKKPKAAAQPYRVLVIYEKTGATWKIVSLMFS